MSPAVDITAAQREMLLALLGRHIPGVEVWAYGSRVKGTARLYSDLDLVALADAEQSRAVPELREALDESDLPFLVDLHLWDELPESFHERIREGYVVVQEALGVRERSWRRWAMASDEVPVKSLVAFTLDGEWGLDPGVPHPYETTEMRVIRGTDFDMVQAGGINSVPVRAVRSDIAERKALKEGDVLIETAGGSAKRSTGRVCFLTASMLEPVRYL